jgi:hypothetical protein
MSGDEESRKGRYHLVLSVELWDALVAEAGWRRMRVSHVVQEQLAASLGITEGVGVQTEERASEVIKPIEKGKRHHCRLSLDSVSWDRLAREAVKRRVSVTDIVRQRLREAVLGEVPGMRWSGSAESANGRSGQYALADGRVEPKSITMYEL